MASQRGTPSSASRSTRARYGPLFAGPQVDQSQSEQPFDGLLPFQAAYCAEQHFGEPFFVPCHHPSLRRVKVHLADAACGS